MRLPRGVEDRYGRIIDTAPRRPSLIAAYHGTGREETLLADLRGSVLFDARNPHIQARRGECVLLRSATAQIFAENRPAHLGLVAAGLSWGRWRSRWSQTQQPGVRWSGFDSVTPSSSSRV